jgi:hypothetical protein
METSQKPFDFAIKEPIIIPEIESGNVLNRNASSQLLIFI